MLPKYLVIVQINMPTSLYKVSGIEELYENIENLFEEEKDCSRVIVGDCNAIAGEGEDGK